MAISLDISAPGAIANLDDLKEWIADEVDRDLAEIGDRLSKCIRMAEADFNRRLRARQMEQTSIGTASTEDTDLPSDYLAMRAIYEEGSPDRPLKAISPTAIRQSYDGTAGTPVAYALVAGGIRLAPPPSSPVQMTMDYWAQIEPLTLYSPSNWLLEEHPDLYVYGALFHYYRWAANREGALDAKGLRDELIMQLNKLAAADRYGAGPLVPSTVRQIGGRAKC
jgi:hypothetical protein